MDSRKPVGTAGLGEAIHHAGAAGDFAEAGGEIGRELYVSVNTVRSQVQAIYRKLGVTSRAEPVAHARHLRLVPGATSSDQ